jgi:DNA-binding NarL/FixJ family response regulator
MRVLVADDHELMRKRLQAFFLGRENVQTVAEAANGREAIEKARELKPDLIIMDVNMPCLDGFEATKEIKKFLPDAAVIILSIHDGTEVIEQSRLAGAQAFVSKEQATSDLLKAVDAALQKKQFFPDSRNPTIR